MRPETAVQNFFRSAMLIFRRVRKPIAKRDYQRHHVCPSVCPRGRPQIPPMNFHSWKYVLGILLKYVDTFQFWLKLDKITDTLHHGYPTRGPLGYIMRAAATFVNYVCKCKGKVFPLQARLWPREWVEIQLYFSMTTALEGVEWSAARPDRTLPPGKNPYPLYRRLGEPQGRSWQAENLASPGFDPRIVQPVVSLYTDWTTRPILETS